MLKSQLKNGLQKRHSHCVSSSSPASTICSVCVETPHWLQEVLPDGGDPGQKLGTDGSQALLHRLVFFWLYLVPPGRINLSKLVWVCFFVLFYSLVHILSPSVLNHLSAGLIQFTEFLSGIWCRSLYHPIPPRPGWCI